MAITRSVRPPGCRWFGAWTVFSTALSSLTVVDASECLVGCTLLGQSPFDSDKLVEWSDRALCDDSLGCEVDTPNGSLSYWVGCGFTDNHRCLWAASSGTDSSSDCTCSVCGAVLSFASSYMEDEPLWTRIACFIAGMEALGFDASICVAAAVDEGTMACVDEPYETPTSYTQFECPSSGLTTVSADDDVCAVAETRRGAEELFPPSPLTPAPTVPSTLRPESVPPTPTPLQEEELFPPSPLTPAPTVPVTLRPESVPPTPTPLQEEELFPPSPLTPVPTVPDTPRPESVPPTPTPLEHEVPTATPAGVIFTPPDESTPAPSTEGDLSDVSTPGESTADSSESILMDQVEELVGPVLGGLVFLCCFIGVVTACCGKEPDEAPRRPRGSAATAGSSGVAAARASNNSATTAPSCACAPCLLAPWKVVWHSGLFVLAIFSPLDYVRDLFAVYWFATNEETSLAAITAVIVFLSARFTALFAALHPKPTIMSMTFHYFLPSWAAYRTYRHDMNKRFTVPPGEKEKMERAKSAIWASGSTSELEAILKKRLETAFAHEEDQQTLWWDAVVFELVLIRFIWISCPVICGTAWAVIKHHANMIKTAYNSHVERITDQDPESLAYQKSFKIVEAMFEASPQLILTVLVGFPEDGVYDLDYYVVAVGIVFSLGAILWAAYEFWPSRKDIQGLMNMLNRGVTAVDSPPPMFTISG